VDAIIDEPASSRALTAEESPPIPNWSRSQSVLAPAVGQPGHWVGAPSATLADDVIYLAYRVRRPIGHGRGSTNVVARSFDGLHFETVAEVHKAAFRAESLERPALVRTEQGRWRLYVSCATPGTSHWRVDVVEADRPDELDASRDVRTVVPGDARTAYKDPVIVLDDEGWHMWVCVHEIPSTGSADAMYTTYATSDDGLSWTHRGVALRGRPGSWDQRGARITDVVRIDGCRYAYYDGRATAEQNWEEQTGVAHEVSAACFEGRSDQPLAVSPTSGGGLRYLSALDLGAGCWRLYYEATCPDGSHDLRTELLHHPDAALLPE
jgi:hypothetical protein